MDNNLSNELNILASLLNTPDLNTKEAVLELANHYQWLKPAAAELEQLPVAVWCAEHNRLFVDDGTANSLISRDGLSAGKRLQNVPLQTLKQLYKRMGLGLLDASADYLATLLECTVYLYANPALGKTFWPELWYEHLAYWGPGFCHRLKCESRLALYRIVAERLCMLFPEVQCLATAA